MIKKLTFLFAAMLFTLTGLSPTWAQTNEFTGKIISVGENATTLEEGKWYVLFNAYTSSYAKEGDNNTLASTNINPNNSNASTNAGYLIKLEQQEDGRYLIKSGLGNYFLQMGNNRNNGTAAEPTEIAPYTISPINGTEGHFTLMSTMKNGLKYYMQANNGALTGHSTSGGANSTRDWVFKQASVTTADALTGKDYVNYMLNKGGLVRLTNRRSSKYSLSDNGTNTIGQITDKNNLQQVWILEKAGSGYTLRNGKTGRFLNDDDNFRSPSSSATTIYIQFSPNNTGTSSWINLSEDDSFNGNVCLNENGDNPTNLFKWTANGDAGSDWTISEVTNFTEEEIMEGLLANSKYKPVESGKIYNIVNMGYGTVIYENTNGNQVRCQNADKSKFSQYWRLINENGKYYIQNVLSERYIKKQNGAFSQIYSTSTTKSAAANGFTLSKTDNDTEHTYAIVDQNPAGLHCDASSNVVGWYYTDNNNSIWGFQPVEVTEEEIAEARKSYVEFEELSKNLSAYNTHMQALFSDLAFTTLKEEIAALTDEELAANADFAALSTVLQGIVLKVKHNDWKQFTDETTGYTADYERFFRIADYKVYSHHQKMSWEDQTDMSNSFGRLSNPTGITGYAGDIVYIFVDGAVSSDCILAAETVTGTSNTGSQTILKPGLNAIMLGDQSNLYIFYELQDPNKYLANYPDVKIHIQGGRLNGYWDATRGMTNADWKLLQKDLLKESPVLNLKTENLVFCMDAVEVKKAEPNEMEGLMHVWNTILTNEERYMGLEEFEGRFRNIWNCFSVDHNYMYASTYGTYYHWNTLGAVMNYHNMTHQGEGNEGGGMWGPSHEIGHNHQKTICVVGTMEASNNMFSNINQFEQGISTTRYSSPIANFEEFNNGKPWSTRDISISTRMYFQLYLYFHEMKNDTTFLPRLFKELRKRPINKHGKGWNGSLVSGENVGGYATQGSQDYLHFAKVVCDVAQADLSEFFESYGMFIPVENHFVGDYANYFVTTTQADIDAARAYMQKYPKKLNNIMFIDDHIATNQKANPNNIFNAVPAANGLKVNCCTYNGSKMGTAGDLGMYTDFKSTYENDGYYYNWNNYSRQVKVVGTGAVGFKVYNNEGRLVYLSNKKTFTLPKDVAENGFIIKAAEGNGADVLVPRGSKNVMIDVYYPGQAESRLLYADGNFEALPTNAIGFVRAEQEQATPEELKALANIVDETGHASIIRIDGNQAWNNPANIQADQVGFTKDIEGYAALNLPFIVSKAEVPGLKTATYIDGTLAIEDAESVDAGQPVILQGNADITVAQTAVVSGNYKAQENITILAADGQSVETAALASPFTYNMQNATGIFGIGEKNEEVLGNTGAIYDLQGRRLKQLPVQKGIYLINGKKVLVK